MAATAHRGIIPVIDVAALFEADRVDRSRPDEALGAAARDSGFACIRGLPDEAVPGPRERARLLGIFAPDESEKRRLYRREFAPENLTAGRIRATEHRVLGGGRERHSIPFFFEAHAEAIIAPLPFDAPDSFAPFAYGEFLWRRMTAFVEFRGLENERAVAAGARRMRPS